MKKILLYSLLATLFLIQCTPKVKDATTSKVKEMTTKVDRSKAPEPGPAKKINIGNYETFKMDNGMTVIVVENHKLPRVSFQLSLDNDALVEGDIAGYVGMAGQMLNKGTKTRTKPQIDEEIDFIGASLNTSSGGVFGGSLKKHMYTLLDLMSDVLLNPSFPQEEFDKIKKQTISGLATQKDNPNAMAGNVSQILNYGKGHPYGETSTEKTVEAITLDKCIEYYNTYFKPNKAYFVVVGDVTADEVKTIANKYFGKWKSGNVPSKTYKMPMAPKTTQVAFVPKEGAVQSVIRVTYPIQFKRGHPDETKALVMNNILGGSFSGRLNLNLREDKAYTYGARSSLSRDDLIGNFSASASVRNEVTDSSLVEFLSEMNRMRNEKITEEDLRFIKNYMTGNFALSMESPQTIAGFALNTIKYNLPQDYYSSYLERLEAVTIDDVYEMAQKYIKPENAHIVVVGNKDEVADKLKKFSANGKVTFYDMYGQEIKDVAGEIPPGVTGLTVVKDYLEAIGGLDKLKSVNSLSVTYSMNMMGQNVSQTFMKKAPNKFAAITEVAGMGVMSEQVFDGAKGYVSQMGQKQPMDETALAKMKKEATMFSEMNYLMEGYKLELKGVENIEGDNVYKMVITAPDGTKSTEYYSQETSLKVKELQSQEGQGGQMQTLTFDLKDYKMVDGIMFPHTVSVAGMMPMAVDMIAEKIVVNGEIDDMKFKVE